MKLTPRQRKLFKTMTALNGVSGQENEIAAYLRQAYRDLGYPIVTDNLGSIFAYKKSNVPNAPKVMVVGHMDEVGFIVISVESNGMLKGHPIGGLNSQTLTAQRVSLKTRHGEYLHGAIGAVPPHLLTEAEREKPMDIKNMLFDFGFTNKKEAEDYGVYVGAMMVVEGEFVELNQGQRLLGKAFDDRYGIILGIELLIELKDADLPVDLYVGGSVQEEVGCRGAITSSYLIQPDIAIILDCSPSRDSSGNKKEYGQLGEGVLLRYVDGSMIAVPELLAFQKECADKAHVKSQYFDSPGGTDAGQIHKNLGGVLTLTHCICARSIHTNSIVMDVEDYVAAKKSLLYMIKHLDEAKITALKGHGS
jgi:glutamyl aminopeptidase